VEAFSVSEFYGRRAVLGLSDEQWALIAAIEDRLADEESRLTFLAALQSRRTGNPGYVPFAPYAQYRHPGVLPESGNVVCEGGVEDGATTLRLAEDVAPGGLVHAFEPVRESYDKCRERLAGIGSIRLHNKALWSFTGTAPFVCNPSSPNSAHIARGGSESGPETEKAACVSVDDFFRDGALDFLKLDIEGGETDVLRGAGRTLARCRPRLAVSMYHRGGADLLDVPAVILAAAFPCRLYVGHHSCWFGETVLYASCRGVS
jgi:FkbM family methyltransferase